MQNMISDLYDNLVFDALVGNKALLYHNDPKFSDRQDLANSADPDQTAPRGAV